MLKLRKREREIEREILNIILKFRCLQNILDLFVNVKQMKSPSVGGK